MATSLEVMCIGTCGWDVIGQSDDRLRGGDDLPGNIRMKPGGVAFNVHEELSRLGIHTHIASAIGSDPAGELLIQWLHSSGMSSDFIIRPDQPTALYAAIEDPAGMIGAISAADTIERSSVELLGLAHRSWSLEADGTCVTVIDGNISVDGFSYLIEKRLFPGTRLVIVSASSRKATRLGMLAGIPGVTIYLNRHEAMSVCGATVPFPDADTASLALVAMGFDRAVVTDGENRISDRSAGEHVTALPDSAKPDRWTGAGDRFLARHLYHELRTHNRLLALELACGARTG